MSTTNQGRPRWPSATAIASLAAALAGINVAAAADAPTVSVGAGVRTSFTSSDSGSTTTNDFNLDSIRLYLNGSVTDDIKFTFNTEYNGSELILMDAIARFEFSDQVNIWAGRFLPPSDRSNLYGPYYANNWKVYIDGVQDMWPSVAVGRDNGIMYWGQFGKVKISTGIFDVPQTFGNSSSNSFDNDVLWAGRAQVDFWDAEAGYYQNATYYGDKDLLAVGVASQAGGYYSAYSGDFLFEKKLMNAGAVGVEAEYYKEKWNEPGTFFDYDYDGYYVLAHYVFPQVVGIGKFQLLGKFGAAGYDGGYDVKTTEVDVNYLIKQFNARASLFYAKQKSDAPGSSSATSVGLGLQLQM